MTPALDFDPSSFVQDRTDVLPLDRDIGERAQHIELRDDGAASSMRPTRPRPRR